MAEFFETYLKHIYYSLEVCFKSFSKPQATVEYLDCQGRFPKSLDKQSWWLVGLPTKGYKK